jgi:hypothetical protein
VVGEESGTIGDLLIKKEKVSPFKLSKGLNLKHCFTIQFKTLVCLKQPIKHTFLYVNKNCILFTPFFKEKFLIITFVMFKKTQEQEIIKLSSWGQVEKNIIQTNHKGHKYKKPQFIILLSKIL